MPGNQDNFGLVLARWFDGSFVYRRSLPETVSTLTPDLPEDCPVEARLKLAAGQHAWPARLAFAQPDGWLPHSIATRRS